MKTLTVAYMTAYAVSGVALMLYAATFASSRSASAGVVQDGGRSSPQQLPIPEVSVERRDFFARPRVGRTPKKSPKVARPQIRHQIKTVVPTKMSLPNIPSESSRDIPQKSIAKKTAVSSSGAMSRQSIPLEQRQTSGIRVQALSAPKAMTLEEELEANRQWRRETLARWAREEEERKKRGTSP
jgi:hypothetical protein